MREKTTIIFLIDYTFSTGFAFDNNYYLQLHSPHIYKSNSKNLCLYSFLFYKVLV